MNWSPPLAEVIAGRWRPGLDHPGFFGWLIVVEYFLTAATCIWADRREPTFGRQRRRGPLRFWLVLACSMALLGLVKWTDLPTYFTLLIRQDIVDKGLYQERRHYQAMFVGGVAVACATLLLGSLWWLRRAIRHRWTSSIGLAFVAGLVVIRAASLHVVDEFLSARVGGLIWNEILELGGISVVMVGALRVSPVAKSTPKRGHSRGIEHRRASWAYLTFTVVVLTLVEFLGRWPRLLPPVSPPSSASPSPEGASPKNHP